MRKKLFINGEWIEAGGYAELFSPYSGEEIGGIPRASEEEVHVAIDTAEKAAKIISIESSKLLKDALVEVEQTVETYKFAKEESKRLSGEIIALNATKGDENRLAYTIRKPIGVVVAITPFDFPQNLVAHKVGPSIATGNIIVLKPASQTPLSAFFLTELLEQTDLPKGVFNLVM